MNMKGQSREGGGGGQERGGKEGGAHRLRSMNARFVFPCSLHIAPAW